MPKQMAERHRQLPVATPDLSGNESKYVADAIASSWISSTGPYVRQFEAEFASWCGTRAAIAVANGTVALHLALLVGGLGPGDEVIIPSLTYIATANAVRYVGATPVFVDVDPATWCIDPDAVEAAMTPRTRGVIAVHLYGQPADMDRLAGLCERHGIWLVEDAAEAHGAVYKGRPVGGLGSVATFSFYGNKILTSGEGGALTVNDPAVEQSIRQYRGQGVDPARRYYFPVVGYNYRLTNVACAILCAQLERADALIAARRRVFEAYRDMLAHVPGLGFQPVTSWATPAPWLFCVTIDAGAFGLTRDALMGELAAQDIETRPFFIPVHTLPPYVGDRVAGTMRHTDRLGATGLNLPTSGAMKPSDVERVADAISRLAQA